MLVRAGAQKEKVAFRDAAKNSRTEQQQIKLTETWKRWWKRRGGKRERDAQRVKEKEREGEREEEVGEGI